MALIIALLLFTVVVGLLSGLIIPLLLVFLLQTGILMLAIWLINGKVDFFRAAKAMILGSLVFVFGLLGSAMTFSLFAGLVPLPFLMAGAFLLTLVLTTMAFSSVLKTSWWRTVLIALVYVVLSVGAGWLAAPDEMEHQLYNPPLHRTI